MNVQPKYANIAYTPIMIYVEIPREQPRWGSAEREKSEAGPQFFP